ncbi:uncharacterized protein M6B38_137035 [Iris pallida]|uniref:DUF4378 domain-containing protein n=1 Tax=Iris pallida TaxID=29817 RepID=A0AAX6FF29_IRIPA|nr:uncharacterized protein M6B38_137035 [Iris pallida]
MDRRVQQRSKYRAAGASPGPAPAERAHADGNDQFKRSLNSLKIASDTSTANGSYIEDKLFTCDSRQSSSRKACGRPIKALIHEEMSRKLETRRSSPSVIARLMGLDALPPAQELVKHQKDMRINSLKTTHTEDISLRMTNTEQEFKDVFEITDSMKVEKHKSRPLCKETPCSKRDETDVTFVKQKLMEAKRLSTEEKVQNSRELNDALEVLNSNDDHVLQFLQEPNSLFTNHLHDLKCPSPSPHESNITDLTSLKDKKREIGEASSDSEAKAESCSYLHKDVVSSCRKPTDGLISHSVKEHSGSLSHKFLELRSMRKTKSSSRPTWIVVLKPSLEKSDKLARIVSPVRSNENHHSGFRRHRDFRQSAVPEVLVEGRERQKLFDNPEVVGHKTKGSREIAREITGQMKRSVSSSEIPFSGSDKHKKYDSLQVKSGRYNLNNSEVHHWTSNNFDYSTTCSSSSSTESSVSKEARRRLSERWRLTQRFQEPRLVDRGTCSSTLGEMLALSDRDASTEALISQKVSDEKLTRDLFRIGRYPSGISSKDGWKEECSKNISRSSSLSASSTGHGTSHLSTKQRIGVTDRCYMLKDVLNLGADDSLPWKLKKRGGSCRSYKSRSYKSHSLNYCEEESKLPVREIHVTQEESRNETNSTNHSEIRSISSQVFLSTNSTSVNQVNSSSIESMDVEVPFLTDEVHAQPGEEDGQFPDDNHTVTDEASEVTLADNPQVDSPRNQCDKTDESRKSPKEDEQPSPVSVLELPYEEHPSPESFERVNAGLQGLRMQLQLLRLEKSDTDDEEYEALISSDDDTGDCSSPEQKAEMLQTFRNEEERDFSYLLDILVDSGVHGAKQDELLDACYSLDNPVHPGVFEKLEKKYDIGEWSRSERKLSFDLISSILAEVLAPFMDLCPWVAPKKWNHSAWGHERLLEDVWQMVGRQRKGTGNREVKILDARWLVLGDDVDMIGRQIECMLKDDLMDELVSDFILG